MIDRDLELKDLSPFEEDGVRGIVNVESALNLAIHAESLEDIRHPWRKAIRDLPDVRLWVLSSIGENPHLKLRLARILRKALDAAIALCGKFGAKGGKGVLAFFAALEEKTKEDPLETFPYDLAGIESWAELHHPRVQGGLAKLREGDTEGALDAFRGGALATSGKPCRDLATHEDALTSLASSLGRFCAKYQRGDENAEALLDARDLILKARTIIGDVRFKVGEND